ncbi:MAG: hypothetical protein P8J02_06475 [Yoonia sp.]|nr:hypothetical protein [Yoonia sp.]
MSRIAPRNSLHMQNNAAIATWPNINVGKVRTVPVRTRRSERPLSAHHVEMCMAQHLSLQGFLAFTSIGNNVRASLIPPLTPKN